MQLLLETETATAKETEKLKKILFLNKRHLNHGKKRRRSRAVERREFATRTHRLRGREQKKIQIIFSFKISLIKKIPKL